jgi:hypothetical protein
VVPVPAADVRVDRERLIELLALQHRPPLGGKGWTVERVDGPIEASGQLPW